MYECSKCKKSFSTASNRARHVRVACQYAVAKQPRPNPPYHFYEPFCMPDNNHIFSCAKAIDSKLTIFQIVRRVSKRLFRISANHRILHTSTRSNTCLVFNAGTWEENEWRPMVQSMCCRVIACVLPIIHDFRDTNIGRLGSRETRMIDAWVEQFTKLHNEHQARQSSIMKLIMHNMREDVIHYTQMMYGKRIDRLGIPDNCIVWKTNTSIDQQHP